MARKKKIDRANDRDPNVKVEIEAARLEFANGRIGGTAGVGYRDHLDSDAGGPYYVLRVNLDRWYAGWLTRELRSHDDHRESRDAYAWTWDPLRPVAGQFEEWVARTDRIIEAMEDDAAAQLAIDQAIDEQTRHDVAASVARHAALPRNVEPITNGLDRLSADLENEHAYADAALEDATSEAIVEQAERAAGGS